MSETLFLFLMDIQFHDSLFITVYTWILTCNFYMGTIKFVDHQVWNLQNECHM